MSKKNTANGAVARQQQSGEAGARTKIVRWLKQPYDQFIAGKGASLDFANAFVNGKKKFVDGICKEVGREHLSNLVFFGDSFISRMHESITGEKALSITILGKIEMPKTDVVLRLSDVSSLDDAINSVLPEGTKAKTQKRIPRFSDESYSFGYLDFMDMLRCIHDKDLSESCARVADSTSPELPFSLNVVIHGNIDADVFARISDVVCGKKFLVKHTCNDEVVEDSFTAIHMGLPVSVRYDHPFFVDIDNFKSFLNGLLLWKEPFSLNTSLYETGDLKSVIVTAKFNDGRQEVFASRPTFNEGRLATIMTGLIKNGLNAMENLQKSNTEEVATA